MEMFSPDPIFGILFAGLLLAGLIWASWWDYTTMIVPKKITIGLLAAGVGMNLIRGIWLGANGHQTWVLPAGPAWGGLDGLLFTLCGFLVGFLVFFVMWILGVAGGGDVKLAAALGAWLGPVYFFGVIFVALPIVVMLTILKIGVAATVGKTVAVGGAPTHQPGGKVSRRVLSFSLPITLAVMVMVIYAFSKGLASS